MKSLVEERLAIISFNSVALSIKYKLVLFAITSDFHEG